MKTFVAKWIALIVITVSLGFWAPSIGCNYHQSLAIAIFSASIFATLFFWDFRLSFAFLGIAILLLTRTIDLKSMVEFSSLEIILFLMGMMVLIELLREAGFFAWLVSLILRIPHLTAKKFLIAVSVLSALLTCAVDEVTSIVFMVAAILEICDYFEVNPVPFVIGSVIAANIGSAGTVLGNPIGILIATKAGLTFEDFIIKAFPLMVICLAATIFMVGVWYRKALRQLDEHIEHLGANEILMRLISVPPEKELKICLGIFGVTLFFIAMHHRLELLLGLDINTVLMAVPLISSGCVMLWRWRKARRYFEKGVDWWTLIFFLLLFSKVGTLKYTGATEVLAEKILSIVKGSPHLLTSVILWASTFGSSILDNVVLVAAFIPIVQSFKDLGVALQPLWWALLFGGCIGGNITLVGSTANIVALGTLEKEKNIKISFARWLGIGLFTSVVNVVIIWVCLLFLPFYK